MAGSEALEVSLRLMLEEQAEIARALAVAGGKAGDEFYKALSPKAQKAFDDLANQAEKAAKDVGAKFSKTDLRFRNSQGQFLSPQDLDALSKANAKFAEARKAVDLFRSAVVETGNQAGQSFNLLESAITGVAVSLTSRLTDAVGTALSSVKGLVGGFLELDGELRLAAAAAGEQGGYERLAAVVDKVGIEAAGTTKQVAELATSLVRAGFSIKEVEAALPGVVKGAEATGTSFASFGDIVGNTLRGFGLEVEETSRVVDVLVNTANSSNASIEGLGYTFEYTAPIAKALGVSLEEVAAAAGLMANAGIQGSVAGTGLRTGLQKLQQAAGGASPQVMGLMRGQERLTGVMRTLGATVVDTNGKLLPLDQVLIKLKGGLEKLNQADQVQLANVLFGDEAGSKFLAILNQSDAAINKLFGDIKNSAGATDTARTAMAGMGLELQQLQGTMDSLGTSVGGVIASGLRPLVGVANAAAGAVSGLPAPAKAAGGALIALGLASTATAVGIGALNVVAGQVGGYAALRAAAASTAASLVGIAAGTSIVLGLAAGLTVLAGGFRETDQTTKSLLVTTTAVGTAIVGWRLGVVVVGSLNKQLGITAALTALISGAKAGGILGAIAGVAAAAGAAALAIKLMNDAIDVTGQDTQELSAKAEGLKDQIADLQDQVERGKKMNIDTTESQARIDKLQLELRQIENPLEIKIEITKAKNQIEALKNQVNKLGEDDSGRAAIESRLKAAERYARFLRAAEGGNTGDLKNFGPNKQSLAQEIQSAKAQIDTLTAKQIDLPLDAKADRDQINKEIGTLQKSVNEKRLRVRLDLEAEEVNAQIIFANAELEKLRKAQSARKGWDSGTKEERDRKEQIRAVEEKITALNREKLTVQEKLIRAFEKQERTARSQVTSEKDKLETAKLNLETQQATASLTDRQKELESGRLRIVQQIADAYSGLASAQAALTQSIFDVYGSRNAFALTTAERELQILKDRGASVEQIQAKEREIARIKRNGEEIEFRAMQAGIAATAQRLEIERKVLGLKQAAQLLEQEGAIRSARQGVLGQEQRMLELRGKALDPNLLPEQKAAIQEQIKLQQQSIDLSRQQVKAEEQRLQSLGVIFGLERQSQEAQQMTVANQQRAAAAAKGWEEGLAGPLMALDEAAQSSDRATTSARELIGTIQAGDGSVQNIYAAVSLLSEPLGAATDWTTALSEGFARANQQAATLLQTVSSLAKAPTARWAGGPMEAGQTADTINELGTESFLSRSGVLSLIRAPAYSSWTAPSPGMVLPAGLTSRLDSMGAFDRGGSRVGPALAGAMPLSPGVGGGFAGVADRLERRMASLEDAMRSYRPMDVQVHTPSNAGLLRALQGL